MTTDQRKKILAKVDDLVRRKYFDPKFNGRDWPRMVAEHEGRIIGAADDEAFEREMNLLLGGLGTSHTAFFGPHTPVPSRSSINATFRAVKTEHGERWAFQDVQPGGPADRAGIKPADLLMAVNNREVSPPVAPEFRMADTTALRVIHRNGAVKELESVSGNSEAEVRRLPVRRTAGGDSESPGEWDRISEGHDVPRHYRHRLRPRGGPRDAGAGELRPPHRRSAGESRRRHWRIALNELFKAGKVPVGYSLTRQRAVAGYRREDLPQFHEIPSRKWELPFLALRFIGRDQSIAVVTEGRGPQRYHGRVVILVNEHTAGTAEMVAGFVRENRLGKIVGGTTAGRLTGGRGSKSIPVLP